jgi:glycine dehydrogenase subunit 1
LPRKFDAPFFNEFVATTNGKSADEINRELLGHNIIGGLPLDRHYPELAGGVLLCATEMSKRADMDRIVEVWNEK